MNYLTDDKGRKIGWQELGPGDFLELMDSVAEAGKGSMGSLGMGAVVASVREVDDVPEPFPASKGELKALADRLGWPTIKALQAAMKPADDPEKKLEAAKN